MKLFPRGPDLSSGPRESRWGRTSCPTRRHRHRPPPRRRSWRPSSWRPSSSRRQRSSRQRLRRPSRGRESTSALEGIGRRRRVNLLGNGGDLRNVGGPRRHHRRGRDGSRIRRAGRRVAGDERRRFRCRNRRGCNGARRTIRGDGRSGRRGRQTRRRRHSLRQRSTRIAAARALTPVAACEAPDAVAPGEPAAVEVALAGFEPPAALSDGAGDFGVGAGAACFGTECMACRIWAKSSLRDFGLLPEDAPCVDESARAESAASVFAESLVGLGRAVGGRDGGAAGTAGTANMGCDLNGANRASALR